MAALAVTAPASCTRQHAGSGASSACAAVKAMLLALLHWHVCTPMAVWLLQAVQSQAATVRRQRGQQRTCSVQGHDDGLAQLLVLGGGLPVLGDQLLQLRQLLVQPRPANEQKVVLQ